MQQLPNILPLLPDELLYSWQSRLALANGYSNVDTFARDYIYPEANAFRSRSERHLGIDGREPFFTFAKSLGIISENEIAALYLRTTIYNAIAPFLSVPQQLQLTQTAKPTEPNSQLRKAVRPLFSQMHICPLCQQEDKKLFGFSYEHRAHQIPGTQVCHIHGVILCDQSGNTLQTNGPLEQMYNLARFVAQLLMTNHTLSLTKTRQLLHTKLGNTREAIQTSLKDCAGMYRMAAVQHLNTAYAYLAADDGLVMASCAFSNAKLFADSCDGAARLSQLWACPSISIINKQPVPSGSRTLESFRSEVKKLVGDSYRVDSVNKNFAEITHCTCGKTSTYRMTDFLAGRRCKDCTPFRSTDSLSQLIQDQSCGRYRLYGRDGINKLLLQDTTNSRIFLMPTELTLQELTRVTPSELLPCQHPTVMKAAGTSDIEQFWQYIQHQYAPRDIIVIEDVETNELTALPRKNLMRRLCERGNLVSLCRGIYAYPKADFSAKEIIEQKYIARRGNIFGYYGDASFAATLGLCEKPNIPTIFSNRKKPYDHGREKIVLDQKFQLRPPKAPVTPDNHHILPLLDFLQYPKKYAQVSEDVMNSSLLEYIVQRKIGRSEISAFFYLYPTWVSQKIHALMEWGD